ncbi:hypothetical protein BLD48_05815 [Exiguobacterium sp. KRL4]|uniref:phBC6A51 family helix-turn-helix protein n=1 Tax=Exiguobacterium sp. KRL4 TaxID=1914536 RepID=UPI0008F8D80D|nr:phBC6A51 family helix-turn-helix protein [Exiguobacterium sp. KRL4]OIN67405.1 hypothetical protein BLD48_05815 [Exiguobacterium sp. KRL4]
MALTPEQQEAIEYLSQPKRSRLTAEDIAKRVGVSRKTIFNWKHDPEFATELKHSIIVGTQDRLPEAMDAIADAVIEDRNAAMAKILLEAHGMLTKKSEVSVSDSKVIDKDALNKRLAAIVAKSGEGSDRV